jgi:hypothetical protein
MEPHKYALTMQKEMIAEIEAAQPDFVVLVNVGSSWLARPDSTLMILNWFENYETTHLQTIGLVEMCPDEPAKYHWGDEAAGTTPRCNSNVWIFKRQDLP